MGGAKIDGFRGKGNGHRDNNSSTGRHNLPRLIRKIHGNGGGKGVLRKRCFAFIIIYYIIACDNIFILCGCSRISHGHEFIDTRFGNMSVNVNERGYIELYACIRATHFCLFFFF